MKTEKHDASTQSTQRSPRILWGSLCLGGLGVGCRCCLVVCVLAVILTPTIRTAAQAPTAPPANVDEGKKLFASYGCYQCHGYEGQGSSATGPRLGPRPLPLASFSKYIRRPTGQMPPYTA